MFCSFRLFSQIESDHAVNSPDSGRIVRKTCRFRDGAGRKVTISAKWPELPDSGGPSLQVV